LYKTDILAYCSVLVAFTSQNTVRLRSIKPWFRSCRWGIFFCRHFATSSSGCLGKGMNAACKTPW